MLLWVKVPKFWIKTKTFPIFTHHNCKHAQQLFSKLLKTVFNAKNPEKVSSQSFPMRSYVMREISTCRNFPMAAIICYPNRTIGYRSRVLFIVQCSFLTFFSCSSLISILASLLCIHNGRLSRSLDSWILLKIWNINKMSISEYI